MIDVWHSFREAFYMLWATLWALVLGFGLSGAVQAFARPEWLRRRLGDHRPASVARASAYGAASSSCSYAASAMARSLFGRGADYLASMVFMFASTNLVVELGLVLLVLIGWQFLAAEFVGGTLMIVLLVLTGGLWARGRALADAKALARSLESSTAHGSHAGGTGPDPAPGWRGLAGWSDAAGYTIGDLKMLRREMVIGFTVAGFLTVFVPTWLWKDLFVHGHGFWTSLENAVVGPLVAVLSFVCSIGNVPLAAALWKGGISFGGVVSFVFADLITLPLLLIYRKQYGPRLAARMLVGFWAVMSAAGLATEYLFRAAGWIPRTRPSVVAGDGIRWDYTTALDIVALVALAGIYWLYRRRDRFGGGTAHAVDPVCGMQVDKSTAPATAGDGEAAVYFCSPHCRDRYLADQGPASSGTPVSLSRRGTASGEGGI